MTFHWMLESLHFQQLKFTWFYLTKVQFNEYKIWQTKKILKDELRGYCLLIVKWKSLCVAAVWLFENFILSLYLICRIYVFVILKELLSKKVLVIHKLKVVFFLIWVHVRVYMLRTYITKIIMNTYILEGIPLNSSSNSFNYWRFIAI